MRDKYEQMQHAGIKKRAHVVIAETALGRSLPSEAEVHHLDGNGRNNDHTNLVICPSHAYHMILHRRQNALDACGNPNWLKCTFCKRWDDPINLVVGKGANDGILIHHRVCKSARQKQRRKEQRGG